MTDVLPTMDQLTNYLHEAVNGPNALASVRKSSLYAPLTQEENVHPCGVGLALALVHDPPILASPPPSGTTVTYVTVVDAVERNGPAARAGMIPGDVVVGVNDVVLAYGRNLYLPDDVAALIRGPEGTRVRISIARGSKRIDFELTRERPIRPGEDRAPATSPSKAPRRAQPATVTPEGKRTGAEGGMDADELFLREECPPFPPARGFSR